VRKLRRLKIKGWDKQTGETTNRWVTKQTYRGETKGRMRKTDRLNIFGWDDWTVEKTNRQVKKRKDG
jgi:hypothetical protein